MTNVSCNNCPEKVEAVLVEKRAAGVVGGPVYALGTEVDGWLWTVVDGYYLFLCPKCSAKFGVHCSCEDHHHHDKTDTAKSVP